MYGDMHFPGTNHAPPPLPPQFMLNGQSRQPVVSLLPTGMLPVGSLWRDRFLAPFAHHGLLLPQPHSAIMVLSFVQGLLYDLIFARDPWISGAQTA